MDIDDLEPQGQKPKPRNLEEMSIEALQEYIAELESEIARARESIAAKQSAQADADTFFRK
ncbi:MAG: DUF1192 domain-containing protein [Rhodospirillales bacterium]|jgi:uncharacterized small protein (DUF1192 family)